MLSAPFSDIIQTNQPTASMTPIAGTDAGNSPPGVQPRALGGAGEKAHDCVQMPENRRGKAAGTLRTPGDSRRQIAQIPNGLSAAASACCGKSSAIRARRGSSGSLWAAAICRVNKAAFVFQVDDAQAGHFLARHQIRHRAQVERLHRRVLGRPAGPRSLRCSAINCARIGMEIRNMPRHGSLPWKARGSRSAPSRSESIACCACRTWRA